MLVPCPTNHGTAVDLDGAFASNIRDVIEQFRPRRIIETGTYYATGTTRIIGAALEQHSKGARFYSIEADGECCMIARRNARETGLSVVILQGLSLPRTMLPDRQTITEQLGVLAQWPEDLWVDHDEAERVDRYFGETEKIEAADDLLGVVLREWKGRCDFMLLDSAGHIGTRELMYATGLLKESCVIALDDTKHVKHAMGVPLIEADPRFEILARGADRQGWIITRFIP